MTNPASKAQPSDDTDRRTALAVDRTILAAERTYAAWMRTGLAALAFSVGARALLGNTVPKWLITPTGCVLALFSAFCFVVAVWRELMPGIAPQPETQRLPAAILITVNGFLLLVSFAAFAGLLFG